MAPGTYTLLVALEEPATVTIGALGERALAAGGYAYVGSAFGPGGLSRIDRHRRVARGESDTRHWHVDYLLGHPATALVDAVTTENMALECAVARELADSEGVELVPGVGASDCDCESHLGHAADVDGLRATVEGAHERARAEQADR